MRRGMCLVFMLCALAGGMGAQAADQAASLASIQAAARSGDAKAEKALGDIYLQGNGVARDPTQAAQWYRKAAEQGYAPAQSVLGTLYIRGMGVPKDDEQAVQWIRKAAEQGDALAQSDLGMMYLRGLAVPKDDAQAVSWIRKSAEQGSSAGQYNLGSFYRRGNAGLPQDDAQAVQWFRKSAEQDLREVGARESRANLCAYGGENDVWCAELETAGRFGPVDDLLASAGRGDIEAQNRLGDIYRRGLGVAKDNAQAAQWYRKAAEQGYAPAQTSLGYLYSAGLGVPKDEAQALAWYCKAAAQGHAGARTNLAITRIYGSPDAEPCTGDGAH